MLTLALSWLLAIPVQAPLVLPMGVEAHASRVLTFPNKRHTVAPDEVVKYLHLHLSTDQGRTWKRVCSVPPEQATVVHTVANDGLYWFTVQYETNAEKRFPMVLTEPPHLRKLYVNSARRPMVDELNRPVVLEECRGWVVVALMGVQAALPHVPVVVPSDGYEMRKNEIAFPVEYNPTTQGQIKKLHLYASDDAGHTWHPVRSCLPSEQHLRYTARRDGLYWFTLQTELQNGTFDPTRPQDSADIVKIYVNTARRKVIPFEHDVREPRVQDPVFAISLSALLLVMRQAPVQLPMDVLERQTPQIKFPVVVATPRRVKQLHLHVSNDKGATWTKVASVAPSSEWLAYKAPQDGLYWFTLQIEGHDGTFEPPHPKDVEPSQKVYFNSAKRKIIPAKPSE